TPPALLIPTARSAASCFSSAMVMMAPRDHSRILPPDRRHPEPAGEGSQRGRRPQPNPLSKLLENLRAARRFSEVVVQDTRVLNAAQHPDRWFSQRPPTRSRASSGVSSVEISRLRARDDGAGLRMTWNLSS